MAKSKTEGREGYEVNPCAYVLELERRIAALEGKKGKAADKAPAPTPPAVP